MRRYTVILEQTSNNWAGFVPELPITVATGSTEEDVVERLRTAIVLHLEALAEHDLPIPNSDELPEITPNMIVRTVEIDAPVST